MIETMAEMKARWKREQYAAVVEAIAAAGSPHKAANLLQTTPGTIYNTLDRGENGTNIKPPKKRRGART